MKRALLAGAAVFVLLPAAGLAQDGEGTEEDARRLGPITVTATRRAESIQTVGLSISAVSGEELQARGAVDFEDYAITIPNLSFGATGDGILANRSISLRGIAGNNTTSFYIDDVPLLESVDPLVQDVERVEVLRGPQGTLYGARGLGGTVRVITKKPEFDEYSGRAHVGLSGTENGGFNYIVDGAVNIPITSTFAARVTAYYQDEEGFFDRVVGPISSPGIPGVAGAPGVIVGGPFVDPTGNSELDDDDDGDGVINNVDDKQIYGGQLAVRWQPTEQLEFNAKLLGQRTELDGFPLADFPFDPANPPAPLELSAGNLTQNRLFNLAEGGTDEFVLASFNAKYDLGWGEISSSTGWFDRDTDEFEDTSEFISFTLFNGIIGLPATPLPSPIFQSLEFQTVVQELRFVSDFDLPLQITTGFFYQNTDDNEAFQPENFAFGLDAAFSPLVTGGALASGATGVGDLIFTSDTTFDVEEIGLYAEGTYDVTNKFSATFGVRWFDTETAFTDQQSGFAVGGIDAVVIPDPALGVDSLDSSEDGFIFKGVLEYEFTDEVYLYASVAEGFRIGGANGSLPAALGCPAQAAAIGIDPADAVTFESDDLINYEGGVKTTWQGGKYTFNASGFYIDFDNIQQSILLPCGFDFIANAGAARSVGFEIEGSAQPIDGLLLDMSIGFADAEFTEDVTGFVADGDRLEQVPRLTLAFSADYEFPLTAEYDGFVRGDFSHVSSSITRTVDAANPRIRGDYQILNGRVGLRRGDYEIAFFVSNLLDEDAIFGDSRTLAAEAAGRPRVVRNRPRTFGVDLRVNF